MVVIQLMEEMVVSQLIDEMVVGLLMEEDHHPKQMNSNKKFDSDIDP
jgi:hypothetical protein